MARLLDALRLEHKSILAVLACLERQVDRLAADTQPDFDIIRAAIEYFDKFPKRCHHPKEDLVFARLAERDPLSAWIVGDLHHAHAQLAAEFRLFKAEIGAVLLEAELPRGEIAREAEAFIAAQRHHVAMEQASFFPAAERALTPEDWLQLDAIVPQGADPLQSNAAEASYDALRRDVLAWDEEDRDARRSGHGAGVDSSLSSSGASIDS